ncbi:hypothetical protein [Streptomyces sp. 2112.2]|uniref:hypothetical protein n=1 Tax=Streptomyces sp. 2112.2 TaxID=1881024 RepID=UPI000B84ECF9|nr:hypothetical protein [Streptomyces sp. 2112.2]
MSENEQVDEAGGRFDPYAYRYAVEGPVRAARYAGPLAEAEGRMGIIDGTAVLTVRVHDTGQHGVTRREAAESLAWGYGVRTRRAYADLLAERLDRHALRIEGDPLAVARFAADLPGLLGAIEDAATAMMRRLARWMRDSAHGQRWTECHGPADWRTERRHWRRSFIRHLARFVGPYAPQVTAPMPDWSEDWLGVSARIAQATAHTIDTEAVRDHMAEALLFAQAVTAEPRIIEPTPQPRTRYASTYDAIHAPQEFSQELGNVVTTYGPDPDAGPELETASAARVENVEAAAVEALAELPEPATTPQASAWRAVRPKRSRARVSPQIVQGRHRYGSISTHSPHTPPGTRRRPPARAERSPAPPARPGRSTRARIRKAPRP